MQIGPIHFFFFFFFFFLCALIWNFTVKSSHSVNLLTLFLSRLSPLSGNQFIAIKWQLPFLNQSKGGGGGGGGGGGNDHRNDFMINFQYKLCGLLNTFMHFADLGFWSFLWPTAIHIFFSFLIISNYKRQSLILISWYINEWWIVNAIPQTARSWTSHYTPLPKDTLSQLPDFNVCIKFIVFIGQIQFLIPRESIQQTVCRFSLNCADGLLKFWNAHKCNKL